MNEASVFDFGNLLIWVPGLIFFAATLVTLYLKNRGGAPKALFVTTLVFFLISLLMAFLVPINQIGKAVEFANDYQYYEGPEIAGYEAIPYEVKDAWFQTALPPEERRGPANTGDIFDFGAPAGDAPQAPGQADADAGSASGQGVDAELVYEPVKSLAWMLLVFFLIPGIIFFIQDRLALLGPPRATA